MEKTTKSHLNPILLTSLVFALLITACTVYYNTSDIKKTFSAAQKESKQLLESITNDRNEKRGIYNHLTKNLADSTLLPYPTLAVKLLEMSELLKKLEQSSSELEALNTQFSQLAKGHKKIESKSSLWKGYQSTKTEYEKETEAFNNLVTSYNKVSNSFVSISHEHKIGKVNVVEIQKHVSDYLTELDKSVAELRSNIEANQKILLQAKEQGMNNRKLASQTKSLQELEEILTIVATKQTELRSFVNQFENEVGEEPVIWSGPGMQTQTIIQDMQRIGAEIEKQSLKFNTLAKRL